jgi:short-subunit dehydrogenase
LDARNALVTGASAGIGRELVRQLVLDRGYRVAATARRGDRLQALAGSLPEGRVLTLSGDLSDGDFRARLWSWAEESTNGIELLVNNAGIGHFAPLVDQSLDVVRSIEEVNFIALVDLTQRALQSMVPRGRGQVLQVSSVLGFVGMPYSAAYVASKHAVNGLVKCLQYELRGTGVRVWAACPGRTESEFYRTALADPRAQGPVPQGEPTDRIARAILRGLDKKATFLFPSAAARAVAVAAHWLGGPYDWWMSRWGPGYFAGEIDRARGQGPSSASVHDAKTND